MPLLTLLLVLIVAGILVGMLPLDPKFRQLAFVVAAVAVVIVLLQSLGAF